MMGKTPFLSERSAYFLIVMLTASIIMMNFEVLNSNKITGLLGDEPREPTCGDYIMDSGEQCDQGSNNGVCPKTCSSECIINSCSASCTQTLTSCNVVDGQLCLFQHYDNCAGRCIQFCDDCFDSVCTRRSSTSATNTSSATNSTRSSNCGLHARMEGFNQGNYNNPSILTPKYKAARVFGCFSTPQLTDEVIGDLAAAGLSPTKLTLDVIDFNVEYEPGKKVGRVDVIRAVESNGIGPAWQWLPVGSAGTSGSGTANCRATPQSPGGSGGSAPNRLDAVEAVNSENPGLIFDDHGFTEAVACRLWREDPRWGRNGKRGDVNDLSHDAIAYRGTNGPGGVDIIDIIQAAGGPNPQPTWNDVTEQTRAGGAIGAWVAPSCSGLAPTQTNTTPTTPRCGDSDGRPIIDSINPNTAVRGITNVKLTGSNLAQSIQLIGGNLGNHTITGQLNSERTELTFVLPNDLPLGNYKVRIFRSRESISNEVNLNVIASAEYNQTQGARTWRPSQPNGRFPKLSPDGLYVTYGFGEIWAADLQQEREYRIGSGLHANWIANDKFYFQNEESGGNTIISEVRVGEWRATPRITDETAKGNSFSAADGHWATGSDENGRIVYDGRVIATGMGTSVSTSDNYLVHPSQDGNTIYIYQNEQQIKTHQAQISIYQLYVHRGYITYGGSGPIRGITPQGQDIDLSITPWRGEGLAQTFFVEGNPWVASAAWNDQTRKSIILLRPWGEKEAIAIDGEATALDVVFTNEMFIVAFSDDQGALSVKWIPRNSQRIDLSIHNIDSNPRDPQPPN